MIIMKINKNDEATEIDDLIENITLDVFNVGSKRINFHIIKSLPTNVGQVMTDTGLTKVPINNHFNELEKHGLLRRDKGTGNAYPTELTSLFKSLLLETEKHVKFNLINMLRETIV